MAQEDYQEIIGQKSMTKVMVGLILLAAAFALAHWNEQEQIKIKSIYKDGPGSAVILGAPQVSPDNEGKLVFFTGTITTDSLLRDRQLGIYANAIKLKRNVQMYQWLEEPVTEEISTAEGTEKKEEFQYKTGWDSVLRETLNFKKPIDPVTNVYRVNPTKMLFNSSEIAATDVKVGEFIVADTLAGVINNYEKLPVPAEILEKFPEEWRGRVSVIDGEYYIGRGNINEPVVGDYRISYEIVKPGDMVSIIGKQVGNAIEDYMSAQSGNIKNVKVGSFGLVEMFNNLPEQEPVTAWSLRAVAVLLVLFGMKFLVVGLGNFSSTLLYSIIFTPLIFALAWKDDQGIFYTLIGISGAAFMILIFSGGFNKVKSVNFKMPKMPERKSANVPGSILNEGVIEQEATAQDYVEPANTPSPTQENFQQYSSPETNTTEPLEYQSDSQTQPEQNQYGDSTIYEGGSGNMTQEHATYESPSIETPQENQYQAQPQEPMYDMGGTPSAEQPSEPVSFRSVPVEEPAPADIGADYSMQQKPEEPAAPEEWQEYSGDETTAPEVTNPQDSAPAESAGGENEYEDIAAQIRKKMSETSTIEFAESVDQEEENGEKN